MLDERGTKEGGFWLHACGMHGQAIAIHRPAAAPALSECFAGCIGVLPSKGQSHHWLLRHGQRLVVLVGKSRLDVCSGWSISRLLVLIVVIQAGYEVMHM